MPQHQQLTADDIWSMLLAIPAYDREDWIRVGMALKSELGNNGFSLFDDWSKTADNYQASAVRSTWRSCRGSGVGIGTLIHMAKANGYRKDAPITPAPLPRRAPKPQQSNTARYAAELWLAADKWMHADDWLSHPSPDESVATHPYAIKKEITSTGGAARGFATGRIIGKNADCIIVPIRERGIGRVQAVECINPQGRKQTFGAKSGGYLLIGAHNENKSIPWYIAEGWASAYATVFQNPNPDGSKWDNCICAVSFGKSNLDACFDQIAEHHAPDSIIVQYEMP
ncbi:PriCT-2 domain-containing protein [Gammaproteobacteria bacterium]|nr:PriCT-2 domain-containing protein [Gammaproteobacteria bacterium]